MSQSVAVILAAGKSTRMKSDLPKVLHEICGRPLLSYVLDACTEAGVGQKIVVIGHRKDKVRELFADRDDIIWVEQNEQLGTGHALLMCEDALKGHEGPVLTIAGDMPLIRSETAGQLLEEIGRSGDGAVLATSIIEDPSGYGRIVRTPEGKLEKIVEHDDCTDDELDIDEVNISYYCFDGRYLMDALKRIKPAGKKNEYYITHTLDILQSDGKTIGVIPAVPEQDALGINSRSDLAMVGGVMQERIQAEWMDKAVSIVDPSSTWIESGVEIGEETTIYPFSFIGHGAKIGSSCRIGPYGHVTGRMRVSDGAHVGPISGEVAART